jgi:hypothetical protein
MKDKLLAKFVKLRQALVAEKAAVEARLVEINQVLGQVAPGAAAAAPARRLGRPPKAKTAAAGPLAAPEKSGTPKKRGGWKRAKNAMTLPAAVIKVTSQKALTKQEILDAVAKLGYQFTTANPLNRLGVVLYGKKSPFKNENGKFSPK